MSLQLMEAARLLGFNPEQGWPETFTTDQATWIQTWKQGETRRSLLASCDDMRRLLALALKAGTVKVTTTTAMRSVEKSKTIEVTFASAHWDGVPGKRRVVRWVEGVEVETHHITAEEFAAWLAANKIEPSRHVAAWFDAAGVGAAREQPQDVASPAPDASKGTPPKLTEADKVEIQRLFNRGRGVSVYALAKKFHVSRPTIDKVLQKAGIKI
ncbi:MAG: hypothetical protein Q7V16_05295 [Hydrogenophaga sp.]|nr:hypothetical protein [Hydrogenophaga sp.]MDP1782667.1 hypothetical protein [Hydrogenophaga sp.]